MISPMKKIILGVWIGFNTAAAAFASDLVLWYDQPVGAAVSSLLTTNPGQPALGLGGGKPSSFISEALPIGNGRLGGLIAGGTALERNEKNIRTNSKQP